MEREMGLNPGERVVRAKAAREAMVVNPIEGPVRAKNETRFKPKSNGSLIPPKRRLVKQMMFECIVKATASCFHPTPKYACKNKKEIFPVQDRVAQSDSSSSV